jgi:hypothetical protein
MALAFLFQQLNRLNLGSELDLTALIVDHTNRHDSAREALTVSRWLKDIGGIYPAAKAPRLTESQASSPASCG